MKVLKAYDFHRNDCTMDIECEHCGHVDVAKSAYNDDYYRNKVVPDRHCPKCGKNSAGKTKDDAAAEPTRPETQEWIFWWALLSYDDQCYIKGKYFPEGENVNLTQQQQKAAWEQEIPIYLLQDEDWLNLAVDWLENTKRFSEPEIKEIWRQVYRIASEKM